MVRLLRGNLLLENDPTGKFQSHNGAIAAFNVRTVNVLEIVSFNPTMVRLLQGWRVSSMQQTSGFNPTMVRLLPLRANLQVAVYPPVSIPQWCDCCLTSPTKSSTPVKVVSIPQWCDCCRRRRSKAMKARMFQSHNGAIAALPKFHL